MTLRSEKNESSERCNLKSDLYEWFEAVVFAVVAVVLIFTFVFRVVGVEGESMKDTLNIQYVRNVNEVEDRLIITKFFYAPKKGDIVVAALPDQSPIIKRVIATEGDTVRIDEATGEVYIREKGASKEYLLDEPYVLDEEYMPSSAYNVGPITIPENCVFLLGDNRNNSKDSRFSVIGCVDEKYIIGKAIFRIYPFDRIGTLYD